MSVTVRIHNAYSDDHESTREVLVPEPEALDYDSLQLWWEEVVYPETGDGHGADNDLGSCYTATVIATEHKLLLGKTQEWID